MIGAGVHNYVGIYNACGQKIFELYFSDQLFFQTFTVGLLVEFID